MAGFAWMSAASDIVMALLGRDTYGGQHNRDLLCGELGYSPAELVKLYQTGII